LIIVCVILFINPELLPDIFRGYCLLLMKLLPEKNNKWATDAWNIILEVARKNVEVARKNIEIYESNIEISESNIESI
tara:strand:- start:428 stop:661 length:234 start_codon:yes stop_codon:yes gene_type:complete